MLSWLIICVVRLDLVCRGESEWAGLLQASTHNLHTI